MSEQNSNISIEKKTVSFDNNVEIKKFIKEEEHQEVCINTKHKYICKKCRKVFKTENAFNNHVRTQVCISTKYKTYCSTCDKLFESRDELDNHLLSLEHYECINNLSNIKPIKKDNKLYNLDPILNNNDIEQMNTIDIGNTFTFIYKNESISKHEIKLNSNNICNIESNISIISNNNNVNDVNTSNNTVDSITVSNEDRKKKIIDFLISNANTKEASKNFLKLLNKLSIEDYEGLNNAIIKSTEIPVLSKQNYIKTIQTFINLLIKKKTKGESKHNGYDIQEIVTMISK
jgi:hypothetical protein